MKRTTLALMVASALVTACGGSGGGGTESQDVPSVPQSGGQTPFDVVRDDEPQVDPTPLETEFPEPVQGEAPEPAEPTAPPPTEAEDVGPTPLVISDSVPLPASGPPSTGGLDSTSPEFERLRATRSPNEIGCFPLMEGMMLDRGAPDLIYDLVLDDSPDGVSLRTWWYASQGYAAFFAWSGAASCIAEDFRFVPATLSEVAAFVERIPDVSSTLIFTADDESASPPEEPVAEEPVVEPPVVEPAPVVGPPPDRDGSGGVNCEDFNTQEGAQRYFESLGADDREGLDADNDGMACEPPPPFVEEPPPPVEEAPQPPTVEAPQPPVVQEPSPPAVEEPPPPVVAPSGPEVPTLEELDDDGNGDVNCSDFDSQEQAQRFFEANRPDEDPYDLDRDGNGIVCESLS